MKTQHLLAVGVLALTLSATLHADSFGSGANAFTIDFVPIGNTGNGNDAGAGGGIYPKRVIGERCCFAQEFGVAGDATVFA